MTTPDFLYQPRGHAWFHPETLVVIRDEDLPDELRPDGRHPLAGADERPAEYPPDMRAGYRRKTRNRRRHR